MSAWTCRQLSARPPLRSFHLVFEPHDGRALAPIPKRSTSPRVTSAPPVVDSLKALDPNRPIREADIAHFCERVENIDPGGRHTGYSPEPIARSSRKRGSRRRRS